MTTSEILSFTEKPIVDESIQEYEHHEYEPQARTNLNSAGEITINIELQDLFTHPSESYLVFDGRLTKADGTAYANDDAVALTNNGIMYLFSNVSYRLSNQEIESVHHPGQATTMLGILKYPDDFARAQGNVGSKSVAVDAGKKLLQRAMEPKSTTRKTNSGEKIQQSLPLLQIMQDST